MRKVYAVVCVLAMAVLLVGCSPQRPPAANTFTRGMAPPPLLKVNEAGYWGLYPVGGMTPIYGPVALTPGQEFGFRYGPEGKVVGYANKVEIPLENWLASSYYWKKELPAKKP